MSERVSVSMTDAGDVTGVVFNIQRYSIHDGPGIRTTAFLKACPLRCLWCQNPESQIKRPEIFFVSENCKGCGACAEVCPQGAIQVIEGLARTDREVCIGCGECTGACPNEARNLMGSIASAQEVFEELAADEIFYQRSGGGVTLSGGEPLAQPRFATEVLRLCKESSIHTALDTCGHASWETVRQVLEYVDLVLYDLKHMDPEQHERYTGVTNEVILENAKRIHQLGIPMLARVPVIPGYNDAAENMMATALFIATELGESTGVHLLPYHRLGETKHVRMEQPDRPLATEPPRDEQMEEVREAIESFGLEVHLGG
jgi:pyruvate formate lyase activating enzyme